MGHRCHLAGPARDHHADLFRTDRPARGLHAAHCAVFDVDAGDLALLDQVHATAVRPAGKAPGDRIVPRGAAAFVIEPAIDREPRLVEIQIGQHTLHARAVQQDRVVALCDHLVAAPRKAVALAVGMEQVDDAALGMHDVVVQIVFQPFPQLQRMAVKLGISGQHVVGAHDGGVAAHIAAAKVSLFQNRHVGDAVLRRQIMRRGQPVTAAADNDDVIFGLRIRIAPVRRPAFVACKAFFQNPQAGKPFCQPIKAHGLLSPRSAQRQAVASRQKYQWGNATLNRFPTRTGQPATGNAAANRHLERYAPARGCRQRRDAPARVLSQTLGAVAGCHAADRHQIGRRAQILDVIA